jgi:Flp pilus assembly CpaE family ATPase
MSYLLIVEIVPQNAVVLVALVSVLRGQQAPSATVVISDGLAESTARCLLKLQIADWLPKSCSEGELVAACEEALSPAASPRAVEHARFTTFVSALGGAGATTLSLAAASAQAPCNLARSQRGRTGSTTTCSR